MRTRLRRLEKRRNQGKELLFFTLVDGSWYQGFISSDEASSAEQVEPAEVERLSYHDDKLVVVIDFDSCQNLDGVP